MKTFSFQETRVKKLKRPYRSSTPTPKLGKLRKQNNPNPFIVTTRANDKKSTPPTQGKPEDNLKADLRTLLKRLNRLKRNVKEFLQTKLGGTKKPKMASQFAQTFHKFLKFAFVRLKQEHEEGWNGLPIDKNIRVIIKTKYNIIDAYLQQFDKVLKPSSTLNKLMHIIQCLRWFHYYSELNNRRGQIKIEAFEYHMKRLRIAYVKEKTKDALSSNTYETMMKEGRLPPNGLQQLNEYVASDYQWAMSLTTKDFCDPRIYNHYMGWLYACFYMSVQGRVGGLQDMKNGQRHGLMKANGVEMACNFKSSYFHALQAVSSSQMSSKGIEHYVKVARPVVVGNNDALNDDNAPLFITHTGRAEYQLGTRLSNYFKIRSNGELKITSTAIRSLYETTSDELYENGRITLEQKNSVTRLGGHNGATTSRYYIKKSLNKSVNHARTVVAIVHSDDTNASAQIPATPVPANDVATTPPSVSDTVPANDVATTPPSVSDTFALQSSIDEMDFSHEIFDELQLEDQDTSQYNDNGYSYFSDNHDCMYRSNEGMSSTSTSISADAGTTAADATISNVGVGYTVHDDELGVQRLVLDSFTNERGSIIGSSSSSSSSNSSSTSSSSSSSSSTSGRSSSISSCSRPPLPLHGCATGQLHLAKRVIWTKEEIEYIRQAYNFLMRNLPEESKRFISKYVLDQIKKDPIALNTIFHQAHITRPEKIRHVIRTYIIPH